MFKNKTHTVLVGVSLKKGTHASGSVVGTGVGRAIEREERLRKEAKHEMSSSPEFQG